MKACAPALILGSLLACSVEPPVRGLILVSIDTLRADRLGAYGYDRPTSPAIDALAARGARFTHAFAETSWTLPAHMTLFTGLHPTSHGMTRKADYELPRGLQTLAQRLEARGFRSFAFTAGGFVHSRFGFGRGFELYDDELEDFASVLAAARELLDALGPDERFLLFLHTYDVHCPYTPPPELAERFRTRPPGDALPPDLCGAEQFARHAPSAGQIRFVSDLYDAGIRAADDRLGEFVAYLDERGLLDDSALVLLSDHGEELGERGRIGHEETLYVESVQVPLLVVAPGIAPRVIEEAAGLVDFVPTALELLGLPHGDAPAQGRSLAPLLRGEPADPAAVFGELTLRGSLRSVLDGGIHAVYSREDDRFERFDLAADPREERPLPADDPRGRALRGRIATHVAALPEPGEVPRTAPPTEEIEQALEALGYVE